MIEISTKKSTRKFQIRHEQQGWFTRRLVSEEGMSQALRYLLEGSKRYLFIINRSTINPSTGAVQDTSITLSEADPPSLEKQPDPRLTRSRRVIIVLIQEDGGVCKIDLTGRKWEIWIKGAALRSKLQVFNRMLRADAYSRLITPAAALSLATLPIWFPTLLFLGWSLYNGKARQEVWVNKTSANIPSPAWIDHFGSATVRVWPILLLLALAIWIIILTSGGLRIWPKYLSRLSFQRAVYEIRSNFAFPRNANAPLFTSVSGAIVGAVITYLLVRFLG